MILNQQFSSRLLENAVDAFSSLPGIGRKTALRLALFILRQDNNTVHLFANALVDFKDNIRFCKVCHNLSDKEICDICSNPSRDESIVCVVENIQDVMAIENTAQYHGLYHVLGGMISPMEGIGPNDLEIDSLVERVKSGNVNEVIYALSPTMEGDTTSFYLSRRLEKCPVKQSTIARGVAIGDELEYTDEITLGRSIVNRVEFKVSQK